MALYKNTAPGEKKKTKKAFANNKWPIILEFLDTINGPWPN